MIQNKFTLPIVVVSFLIAETVFIAADKIYLEKISARADKFRIDLSQNLDNNLRTLSKKQMRVVWNGSQKSYIPISDITASYYRRYIEKQNLEVNYKKLNDLLAALAPAINQDAVNARVEFSEKDKKVNEFSLPQNGQKLNIEKSATEVARALAAGRITAYLTVEKITPAITANSLQRLGITALLAKGESDFKGSSPSRINNIKVGSAKFQGLFIKPGEEFSFNSVLGDISDKTGYQYELVVKNKKLVPEYGGGLCQVSTTLFRAAVLSGLPILERRPHSLPVKYYNPQGFDATIYPGASDLRFTNDTPKDILIQTKIKGTELIFEIYGSEDGRKVEIDGPKVTEENPDGSIKTVLTRKITLSDGSVKENYFKSDYKSPYLFSVEKNPLE